MGLKAGESPMKYYKDKNKDAKKENMKERLNEKLKKGVVGKFLGFSAGVGKKFHDAVVGSKSKPKADARGLHGEGESRQK